MAAIMRNKKLIFMGIIAVVVSCARESFAQNGYALPASVLLLAVGLVANLGGASLFATLCAAATAVISGFIGFGNHNANYLVSFLASLVAIWYMFKPEGNSKLYVLLGWMAVLIPALFWFLWYEGGIYVYVIVEWFVSVIVAVPVGLMLTFAFNGPKPGEVPEPEPENEPEPQGNTNPDAKTAEEVDFNDAHYEIFKHIVLLLLTCGIWYYIWIYRMTRYLNCVEGEEYRDPTKKLLLCIFVPFYAVYWVYKSAQRVDKLAKQKGISSDISTMCLVLAIFVGIVPPIIIQDKVNAIIAGKPAAVAAAAPAPAPVAAAVQPVNDGMAEMEKLERLAKLHEQGILTDEEFQQKKSELLAKL